MVNEAFDSKVVYFDERQSGYLEFGKDVELLQTKYKLEKQEITFSSKRWGDNTSSVGTDRGSSSSKEIYSKTEK